MDAPNTPPPAKRQRINIPLEEFQPLWFSLTPIKTIAQKFNVSTSALYAFAKRHNMPANRDAATQNEALKTLPKPKRRYVKIDDINDPSPEEIEARAAEIRAGWSDAELARNESTDAYSVRLRSYAFDGRTTTFSPIEE